MNKSEILTKASDLINGDRQEQYGAAEVNFKRIATMWSVILKTDVSPAQVCLCMTGLKIARLCEGPHADSYVDGAGYIALAGELGLKDQG